MEKFDTELNKRVIELMKREGLTGTELAEKTGVTSATISRIVTFERPVTPNIIQRISETFPRVSKKYMTSGEGSLYKKSQEEELKEAIELMKVFEVFEKVFRNGKDIEAIKAKLKSYDKELSEIRAILTK